DLFLTNEFPTYEIYTLSLHDALPILEIYGGPELDRLMNADRRYNYYTYDDQTDNYTQTHSHLHYTYLANEKWNLNTALHYTRGRSEEHTSELQSRENLVCRLLLEKKK